MKPYPPVPPSKSQRFQSITNSSLDFSFLFFLKLNSVENHTCHTKSALMFRGGQFNMEVDSRVSVFLRFRTNHLQHDFSWERNLPLQKMSVSNRLSAALQSRWPGICSILLYIPYVCHLTMGSKEARNPRQGATFSSFSSSSSGKTKKQTKQNKKNSTRM